MKPEWEWAARLGEAAREAGIVLSVHAPIPAFGPPPPRRGQEEARGRDADHTAGVAVATGAELVVFHPGFLLGRSREDALEAVVARLAELRERLEAKDRAVPFGIEIMGRVRDLGTAEDVFYVAAKLPWIRPVIDFAHLHAVTDGAFTDVEAFAAVLEAADDLLEPEARSTFTSATSGTRTGTRIATCRTARARCAPSRSRRPSRGSSGRPR